MDKVVPFVGVLVVAFMVHWLQQWITPIHDVESLLENTAAPEELRERSQKYKQQGVVKVTDGVYVALNFAIANCIMLVGPEGRVIVDTTESVTAAREILHHFNNITTITTRAIVYTHHHADHTTGTLAFVENEPVPPEIIAHRLLLEEEAKVHMNSRVMYVRTVHQLGMTIGKGWISSGIGRNLRYDNPLIFRPAPTRFIDHDEDITIAGLKLQFLHVPGETADQMAVWYPDKRVLLVADDIYESFPNLYAIRGVTPRDAKDWAESLDKMRRLRPLCIVGSHGKPRCGEDEVYQLLSDYMYGIQYVHDQTVRHMNKGMHPDEIAKTVKLPPELENHPYLRPFYGTVPWSVKGIYMFYLGWFSGDAVDLNPFTPSERAVRMIELVGRKGLLKAAEKAQTKGDYQWALELSSHVYLLEPTNSWARIIRRDALQSLASQQISANGRNYYLTALRTAEVGLPKLDHTANVLVLPLETIFMNMRVTLKAEALPVGEDITGCFHFTDTVRTICGRIHKGILEVSYEQISQWTFRLSTKETVFREFLTNPSSSAVTDLSRAIHIEGEVGDLRRFMSYFES